MEETWAGSIEVAPPAGQAHGFFDDLPPWIAGAKADRRSTPRSAKAAVFLNHHERITHLMSLRARPILETAPHTAKATPARTSRSTKKQLYIRIRKRVLYRLLKVAKPCSLENPLKKGSPALALADYKNAVERKNKQPSSVNSQLLQKTSIVTVVLGSIRP